jgi:putative ABC transport system permease protein
VAMSEQPEVDVSVISPDYVNAMRIPLLRGRDFSDGDVAGRPTAILISQSLAKQFWPNEDPIGKHITLTFFPGGARSVVGVVGDVKKDGLDQTRSASALYVPLGQMAAPKNEKWQSFPMTLVVRSTANPANLTSSVMAAIQDADHDMPVTHVQTMDELVERSLSQQKLDLSLLGAFAVLAMILAAIGIYSVLSYSVKRRVQEIGIRLALGASLSDVLGMVVFEGMAPTVLGVGIGAAGALALARVMSSLIYGVKPSDPLTFLSVALVLGIVALLASLIPAYRAAKVDPMVALRCE